MEQPTLSSQQESLKESELNFSASAFVPSKAAITQADYPDPNYAPSNPDSAWQMPETSELWCDIADTPDPNELHSELYFAVADAQELQRALVQKKEEITRVMQEQDALKATLENSSCTEETIEADKIKKSQIRKLKTTLRAAQNEIVKLDQSIVWEGTAVQMGNLEPHWLVIGSEWDLEHGSWKTQCGHMCVAGDSWSQSLHQCRLELIEAVESVKRQQELLLESTHKNQLKKSQQKAAGLKATLKVLRREKNELDAASSRARKNVTRLQARIRTSNLSWPKSDSHSNNTTMHQ